MRDGGSTSRARSVVRLVLAASIGLLVTLASVAPALAVDDDPSKDPVARARYEQVGKLIGMKKHEEARAVGRLLVSEHPKWALGWVVFGIAHTNDEAYYDIAEEALEHAQKLDPKSAAPPHHPTAARPASSMASRAWENAVATR